MHSIEPVELSGELIRIQPLQVEHAVGLLAAADADEVFRWLPYSRPTSLREARLWIEDAHADRAAGRRFPFAVLDAGGRTMVGSTSYWHFDARNAHIEIGSTWFRRTAWGTGCNLEAKLLLITHAFDTLGLERVSFRTDICNQRSQRAIESLGATREGIHRHEMRRRDGSWRDSVHYAILRSEWPTARNELLRRARCHSKHTNRYHARPPHLRNDDS